MKTRPLLTSGLLAAWWLLGACPVPAEIIKAPAPGTKIVLLSRPDGSIEVQRLPLTKAERAKAAAPAAAPVVDAVPQPVEELAATRRRKILDEGFTTLNLDRPIPANPAFTALDLSPESVTQPATPRDFAAALLNGVDRQGVLQTGLAVEVTPFRFLPVANRDQDYNFYTTPGLKGWWNRFLYNFSLSLGTAKASESDDKAVRLAIGAQAVLWQDRESDPRTSSMLRGPFHETFDGKVKPAPFDVPLPEESASNAQSFAEAVSLFRQKHWAGTLWTASIAPTWHSSNGTVTDLQTEGFSAWSTFAYTFDRQILDDRASVQLLAHLRYREGEVVTDPTNKKHSASQNTLLAAGRLRIGSPDFNGFAEAGYLNITNGLDGDGSAFRYSAGLERRIGPNLWLVITAGEQTSGPSADDELFAIGSIRIGASDTATVPTRAK